MARLHRHILVVDDNDDTREALMALLALRGYRVTGVVDGVDALDVLKHQHGVAVIILDLAMPRMDGYSFHAALQAEPRLADIPVVVYSAHTGGKQVDGAAATIRKADDPARLLAVVDRLSFAGY